MKKSRRQRKIEKALQQAKAANREAHFTSGGIPATWTQRPAATKDRRKERDRRACRRPVGEDG